VGVSVVKVLRRLGVAVGFPQDQTCCGQPVYNTGYNHEARTLAKRVLEQFRDSQYVVVPSGSCAATLRVFYLELFADDSQLLGEAKALATKTYEFSEFLVKVLKVEDASACGASYHGTATYHPSCHLLREMEVKEEPKKLLRSVPGLEEKELEGAEICCGFGGTFAVKHGDISNAMVADKSANLLAADVVRYVSADWGCMMNINGALRHQKAPLQGEHIASYLLSRTTAGGEI